MIRTRLLIAPLALAIIAPSFAADDPPKTLMTERGKLLFSDDFTKAPGAEWKAGKGKWEFIDGSLRGSELKSDMHGAVIRHAMPFRNAVIQYSFKLDGTKQTTLSINMAKGHLCRVLLNADGFTVRKDDSDKDGPDKAATLEAKKIAIKPGVWHTLVVEMQGKEMLASIDGQHVAFGANDALDVDKANFGLTVAGEFAAFKDLRVWEAQPNKTWEETKKKLTAEREKSAAPK